MSSNYAMRLAVLGVSLAFVFLIIPFGLNLVGISLITSLAFTMLVIALMMDALLTRAGMKRKGTETNPFYSKIKKRMTNDQFLISSTAIGIALGISLLIFLRNPLIILMFAMLLFVGPFITSLTFSEIGRLQTPVRRFDIDNTLSHEDVH